ncbi:hypothetical protein L9F63_024947, partial [Diploptera punctata]
DQGRPQVFISRRARNTQNISNKVRATFLILQTVDGIMVYLRFYLDGSHFLLPKWLGIEALLEMMLTSRIDQNNKNNVEKIPDQG